MHADEWMATFKESDKMITIYVFKSNKMHAYVKALHNRLDQNVYLFLNIILPGLINIIYFMAYSWKGEADNITSCKAF